MAKGKITHKNFEIDYDDETASAPAEGTPGKPLKKLEIAGKTVDVWEMEPGKYTTSHLPYSTYETLTDLAKAVVDDSPDFDTTSDK